VISTFNTSSRGPTHQSLTDTDMGYNLEGASFSHHSHRPSQPTVLLFPLRAPSGLQLTMIHKKLSRSKYLKAYCHHVVFRPHDHLPWPTSTPSKAIDLYLVVGINKEGTEVTLMHLGHQFNSYDLTHNQDLHESIKLRKTQG
jgi:hypothetical protein